MHLEIVFFYSHCFVVLPSGAHFSFGEFVLHSPIGSYHCSMGFLYLFADWACALLFLRCCPWLVGSGKRLDQTMSVQLHLQECQLNKTYVPCKGTAVTLPTISMRMPRSFLGPEGRLDSFICFGRKRAATQKWNWLNRREWVQSFFLAALGVAAQSQRHMKHVTHRSEIVWPTRATACVCCQKRNN